VCDEFWLVSRGGIEPFDGDLDDYQRYLLDVAKQSREAQRQEQRAAQAAPPPVPAPQTATAPTAGPDQRKQEALKREQLKPLKKELERVEKQMAQFTQERTALEARLNGPAAPAELAEAGRQLKAVHASLEPLEERWLELTEQIEAVSTT
jgi:ATP-binding cassette subfamily F protein 3